MATTSARSPATCTGSPTPTTRRCSSARGAASSWSTPRRPSATTCCAPSTTSPGPTAGPLASAADPNRPLPTVTFQDKHHLGVGGEVLQLEYHGANHAPGNIFIYAPDYATLMVVDVLFPGWAPFKNLAVSQDIPDWVKAQSIAMDYPWQTLVGGHLGRLGARADGELQIQYMNDLDASTRAAIASVDPTPFFAKYGAQGNAWAIFKTYLDAVAQTAAAPVTAKYTGLLAAADVFTVDNAWTLLESLRIDTGTLGPFSVRP